MVSELLSSQLMRFEVVLAGIRLRAPARASASDADLELNRARPHRRTSPHLVLMSAEPPSLSLCAWCRIFPEAPLTICAVPWVRPDELLMRTMVI